MALVLVGCGDETAPAPTDEPTPTPEPTPDQPTPPPPPVADCGTARFGGVAIPVRLQVEQLADARAAGYLAARAAGLYEEAGLDVELLGGEDEAVVERVSDPAGPEFGVAWLPHMMRAVEAGADLVNVAQVFQRSGTVSMAWGDSGVREPADFEGLRVGVWEGEYEVMAAARAAGLEPARDYQRVAHGPDLALLLNREVDAAQAMIYDQYAQALATVNPDTGELYRADDFSVIDYNELGTATLQDHIVARASWLAGETNGVVNEDVAACFLRASFEGWIICRDEPGACVDLVMAEDPPHGEGHVAWMMNEINALIWPSPDGIGIVDADLLRQTIEICLDWGVIDEEPPPRSVRDDLAERALSGVAGDAVGAGFQKTDIPITPGGE